MLARPPWATLIAALALLGACSTTRSVATPTTPATRLPTASPTATVTAPVSPQPVAPARPLPTLASPAPHPSTPVASTRPPPAGVAFVISNTDQGRTVTLPLGSAAELRLGMGLRWSAPTVSGTATLVVTRETLFPDPGYSAWRVTAAGRGTSTLQSTGLPICGPGQMCAQFVLLFRVTILVP